MEWLDKLITLGDNTQVVILQHTMYEGNIYVLANEVINGTQLGEEKTLYRVENPDGNPRFVPEANLWTCSKVLWKMSKEE